MKDCLKIKVILSWEDDNYCCKFKRGNETEDWKDMTRDEQLRAVGVMATMAEMFQKFVKEID